MAEDTDCDDEELSFIERLKNCVGNDGSGTGKVED